MPQKKKTETTNQLSGYYTKYTIHKHHYIPFKYTEPSQTSQGEAVSMAEMIRRYTRGEIPPLAEAAFHGRDIDMDKYSGSRPPQDLSEVSSLAELEKQRQEELKRLEALKTSRPKEGEKEQGSEAMKSESNSERSGETDEA